MRRLESGAPRLSLLPSTLELALLLPDATPPDAISPPASLSLALFESPPPPPTPPADPADAAGAKAAVRDWRTAIGDALVAKCADSELLVRHCK